MQIDVKIGRIGSEVDTTVIIGLFKEERLEESDAAVMESALHRYLRDVLALGDFKGEDQEVAVLYPLGQAPPGRVILVGLGSRDEFSLETARRASGIAVRRALKLGVSELSITVHGPGGEGAPDGPAPAHQTAPAHRDSSFGTAHRPRWKVCCLARTGTTTSRPAMKIDPGSSR